MTQLLPDEPTLRQMILRKTGMTGAKLDQELQKLLICKFYQSKRELAYYHIAKKHNVSIDVEYATTFEGPTEEEIQPEEEYTLLKDWQSSTLRVFNFRGMFLRAFAEGETERKQPKRTIVAIDESDEQLITMYGDNVKDIRVLQAGDLIHLTSIERFLTNKGFEILMCKEGYGSLKKIQYGEYDTHEQMWYQTQVPTIEEAIKGNKDFYTLRGFFAEKEASRTMAICPKCRNVFRGAYRIQRWMHCKKCGHVEVMEFTRWKLMFVDDSGKDVTASPTKASDINVDEILLIDPPESWPHYFVSGRMSEDRKTFYITSLVRIPDPVIEAQEAVIKSVEVEEDPNKVLDEVIQATEGDKDAYGTMTPQEYHEAETEIMTAILANEILEPLDFSCDKDAYWPDDGVEHEEMLAAMRDHYEQTKQIWGAVEPAMLQKVLSNQEGMKEGKPIQIYQIQPILLDFLIRGIARVEHGKIVPI